MRSRGVLVGVIALAGCFDPHFSDHPACDPVTEACPADEKCLRGVCVSQGCAGSPDTTLCANVNVPDGVCLHESCVPVGCGDGIMEPGEVCDDGNLVSGDGCSGDCKSDETCGNGFLDAITGEQCDSGTPGLSNDGCSSVCTVEILDWRNVTPATVTPSIAPSMAFDSDRGVMVVFGGSTSLSDHTGLAETWEYGGANWYARAPVQSPPAPQTTLAFNMTYDPHRHRMVLVDAGMTWEYDGVTWASRVAAPTNAGPMAFDSAAGIVVMFDGAQTWTYDGTSWAPFVTTGAPSLGVRWMTEHPSDGCIWAFSGSDAWKLCGSTWTQLASWSASGPGLSSPVAFSEGCNCAVYFDGTNTWQFNGSSWAQNVIPPPSPSYGWVLAADATRNRVVLFGGSGRGNQTGHPLNETWEYDGTSWQLQARAAESAPSGRSTVFDAQLGRATSFEGNDFWEFDGVGWRRHVTAHAAPNGTMAYDDALGVVIAFDGATWQFDGTDWAPLVTSHAPTFSDRIMVYDSTRRRIVMVVGGRDGTGQTWELDGSDWTQVVGSQPSPRVYESLSFDASRGRVVLFGGSQLRGDTRFDVNDTWEYDGHDWHDVTPTQSPSLREQALMAYDRRRQRTVLFGGAHVVQQPVSVTTLLGDTWEWDGAAWTPLPTASRPPVGVGEETFDTARSQIVALMALNGTFTLSYASAATPADVCDAAFDSDGDGLIGCADPDCAGYCTPACPPGSDPASCDASAPHCGDHVCNPWLEPAACPTDCP